MYNIENYGYEIEKIRKRYQDNKELLYLPKPPKWLLRDPLSITYRNLEELRQNGKIVYACMVQANELLFEYGKLLGGHRIYPIIYLERNPSIVMLLPYQYLEDIENKKQSKFRLKQEFRSGMEFY